MTNPHHHKGVFFSALTLLSVLFTCVCVCHGLLPFQYDKNLTSEINLFGSDEKSSSGDLHTVLSLESDYDTDSPSVQVSYDDEKIWQAETRVNIFKSSYQGSGGNVTVLSDKGDRVVAPGTASDYHFKINNLSKKAVDYSLKGEAYFSSNSYPVPVKIRLSDHAGKYIIGSSSNWAGVLSLNNLDHTGVLDSQNYEFFSFSWIWPFESGDDEYDTMLGNLAASGEDLTLIVVFKVTASYNEDEPGPSPVDPDNHGIPINTGETANIVFWIATFIGSFVGLLILSFCYSGKRRDSREL